MKLLAPYSRQWIVLCLVLSAKGMLNAAPEMSAEQVEFFESRIRPVLAQECYECHNSRDKAKSGLVLDHRDGLLKGGDMGPSIVPGKPEESILMEALRHENDLTMPKAGVKLDPPIIADFEKWIAMSAPDPRDDPPSEEELARDTNWDAILQTRKNWWSFQPIKKPESPQDVDGFLAEKIKQANLPVSPPASVDKVARRLYFTLIGLPPTAEQIRQFKSAAAKDEAKALEDLTDTLLDSPQFGERWARHWMDWVRYAESHGSEGDPRIDNAHLYRDYLIRALNADVPYDQLLREHVAGDLLKSPRINKDLGVNESMIGTAHWRMVFHGFAPTDALDEKVRFTDDQINVFTKAFQSLTVSCARCHNHKFDAISQADYYALFGIFGSTRPGRKLIDLPEALNRNQAGIQSLKPEIRLALGKDWMVAASRLATRLKNDTSLSESGKDKTSILHAWYLASRGQEVKQVWEKQKSQWQQQRQREEDFIAKGRNWDLGREEEYSDWFRYGNGLPDKPARAGDFSLLAEGGQVVGQVLPAGVYSHLLTTKAAARLTSSDIHLDDEYELYVQVRGGGQSMQRYVVQNYPRSGTVFKVTELGKGGKKGKGIPGWSWAHFDLSYWKGDDIHMETVTARDAPLLTKNVDRSWFGIRKAVMVKKGSENKPAVTGGLEHVGELYKRDRKPASQEDLAELYQQTLLTAVEKWTKNQASDEQALFLDRALAEGLLPNTLKELPASAPLVNQYRKLEAQIPVPIRVHGLDEWQASDQPLFSRGNHKKPLDPVPRRFLEAIDKTAYKSEISGRLELAEDLLREDNPFTRRVIVNRLWHHVYGTGIVPTADNFGRMGEKPSHPELLDFLAVKFSDDFHWSIKKMIRYLVSTQAFRRDSKPAEGVESSDPANRLLTHYPVKRLEAEAVRDALLQVSGSLDDQQFGNPVSGDTPRRSVYVNVIRNRLDPFLSVYDAPVPFSATGRRSETNVPAQSLTMLNNAFVVKAAEGFARQKQGIGDEERIASMWKEALGRLPSGEEMKYAQGFVKDLRRTANDLDDTHEALQAKLDKLRKQRRAILDPRRKELEAEIAAKQKKKKDGGTVSLPGEVGRWNFAEGLADQAGDADIELAGSARIEEGALLVDGNGLGKSKPLAVDLKEKTLQVRVSLDDLNQRGGGAMTVQDLQGVLFDSVVFAERKPKRWMAGSNNFKRTKDFNGSDELEADKEPVILTLVYSADGTIHGYRNGRPYGKPYQAGSVQEYKKGQAQVIFGLRHGTGPGGNRSLKGKIHEAVLFDRALSEEEVAAAASGINNYISPRKVMESLTDVQRQEIEGIDRQISKLEAERKSLGEKLGESEIWKNLAHSIFNLKEFIYVY